MTKLNTKSVLFLVLLVGIASGHVLVKRQLSFGNFGQTFSGFVANVTSTFTAAADHVSSQVSRRTDEALASIREGVASARNQLNETYNQLTDNISVDGIVSNLQGHLESAQGAVSEQYTVARDRVSEAQQQISEAVQNLRNDDDD